MALLGPFYPLEQLFLILTILPDRYLDITREESEIEKLTSLALAVFALSEARSLLVGGGRRVRYSP